jgi:hypothetical protein
MSFLGVVGVILDGGGIHHPLGCCTGHPFGWGVGLGLFFSEFKVGGRDLPGVRLHTLGWFLPGKSAFIL